MLASSLKTSLMASANRSSTRFETRVHAPALCLPRGRRLVVTSGHCAGTYLIPFYLEGGEYHDCMCALREVAFRDSLPLRVSAFHGVHVPWHDGVPAPRRGVRGKRVT